MNNQHTLHEETLMQAIIDIPDERVYFSLLERISHVRHTQVAVVKILAGCHSVGLKWIPSPLVSNIMGRGVLSALHILGDKGLVVLRSPEETPYVYRLSDDLFHDILPDSKCLNIGEGDVFNQSSSKEVK